MRCGDVSSQAQVARDLVGGQEADAPDVAGQTVGVLGDFGDGVVAVLLVDLDRQPGGNLVALQEEHHFLDGLLLLPRFGDQPRALGPHVRNLAQPFRLAIQHVERRQPEVIDDPLGDLGPDALDQPAAQIAAHPFDRGGDALPNGFRLELLPVARVVDPLAVKLDRLARLKLRQRPDDRDRPVAGDAQPQLLRPQPQDGIAVLVVVIGDPLDRAFEFFRHNIVLRLFWQRPGQPPRFQH